MKKRIISTVCTVVAMLMTFSVWNAFPASAENRMSSADETAVTAEKITDIEQIRAMLIAFVEENGLDARIVSDKEYPGYQPIVVEFHQDAEINAWAAVCDYIKEQNIDNFHINVVPIVEGKPITTVNPEIENVPYGDANCDNNVDVSDAVLVARFAAEDNTAVITEQGKRNADMNRDGNLTGDDVTAILRKIAKLD